MDVVRDGQSQKSDPDGLALLDAQASPLSGQSSVPSEPSLAHQLKEIADLHAAGVLSDAEFEQAKARLLT